MSRFAVSEEASFGSALLDEVVEWVGRNIDPGEIFSDEKLKDYVSCMRDITPDELFLRDDLKALALSNGFVEDKE